MFNLGKNLSDLMRKILSRSSIDKGAVEALIKNLQKLLLQADVDVGLVYEMSKNIRKKCLEQKLPAGLTLREHVMKVVYDELVDLLGGKPSTLTGKKRLMFVGLFGSGKTTTIGKVAKHFQKQGLRPALIACDYHRPAAPEQLRQTGDKIRIPTHISKDKDPYRALKEGLNKFKKYDTVLIDTAGRDALDKELAGELKKMHQIAKPDETLLVIPADIGRVAGKQAAEFNRLVGINGVIVTKMDGTAKGGGALSACAATDAKVKFIGVGEKIADLEAYDPTRYVSRLLGMGDLQTLLEKAKEAEFKKEDADKILSGKFTLQEFYDQIQNVQKMGSFDKIMEMIPGAKQAIPEDLLQVQEGKMKRFKFIMDSMTKEEKENPDVIHASRIKRIAAGAGVNQKDVRDLLKQFEQSKKLIKKIGGKRGLKSGAFKRMAKKLGMKL